MTKTRPRQLELPVMVDLKAKATAGSAAGKVPGSEASASTFSPGFHKPASVDDQSIYKAISDNYFKSAAKQA